MNEFIFLRDPNMIVSGGNGGLVSMIMDVPTGAIIECDVLYDTGNTTSGTLGRFWGTTGPQFSTTLAHEIGHFLGLGHTNLHFGGRTPPLSGSAPSLISFPTLGALPAMVGAFVPDDPAGRVGGALASPWRQDDIAGLARLYAVPTLTPVTRHIINQTATIMGSVVQAPGSNAGVFGLNAYVLPSAATGTPVFPPAGPPPVGTITGTARLSPSSVTGLQDTMGPGDLGSSGEFRIDGIPVAPSTITRFDVIVERLALLGIGQGNYGEWWIDPVINPTLNNFQTFPVPAQAGIVSDLGGSLPGPSGGTVQVGSTDMAQGSIITLATPIVMATGATIEGVSRPVVEILQRTTVPAGGGSVPIRVTHNYASGVTPGTNPLMVRPSLNATGIAAAYGTTTGGPEGMAPFVSTYSVTMPGPMPSPAILTVSAREFMVTGGYPTVWGVNEVRY